MGEHQEDFPLWSPGGPEASWGWDMMGQFRALAAFPPRLLTLTDPPTHPTHGYQAPTTCHAFFQALGIQQ